jgi:hypothetical protein
VSSIRRGSCFRYGRLIPLVVLLVGSCGSTLCAQSSDGMNAGVASGDSAASGSLSGQVVNAITGLPVPRALVRMNDRAVLTDHDGRFELNQMADVQGNLQVTKPGFSASPDPSDVGGQFIRVSQAGERLQLRLYPEAVLTGMLTGPDGYPLPQIPVSAMRSDYEGDEHRWSSAGQAVTDSHGNFRIPVSAGYYRLETQYSPRNLYTVEAVLPLVVPDESSPNTSDVIRVHSGEEQHFDLHPAMGMVHLVNAAMELGGERGFPAITARSSHGAELRINTIRRGPSGSFGFELPNGTYALTAALNTPDGLEQAETSVTVAGHDVSGVVFRFSPVPVLPVELSVDGPETSDNAKPNLLQVGLTLENNQPDSTRGDSAIRLSPQRDRSFGFAVPPGSYRLKARNSGEWYVKSASYGASDLLQEDVVVAPGSGGTAIRVVVSNQIGSLQGTVMLNGKPAPCWVYLISTTPSAAAVTRFRSGEDGTYTSARLAPGNYQAVAFESRHSADYREAASLAPYSTHVRSVTIQAGDKASLDLDAVSAGEMVP